MKNLVITAWLAIWLTQLAAQNVAPKDENVLRIMCYNVHNFVGMDGQRNYQRIADVINSVAPDVVAIQEADSTTRRSAGVYTLKEVAERTDMFAVYAPAIEYQGGKYGVGILSKTPPVAVKQYALPGREERRTLLVAEFEKYIVACTHFSLNGDDRLASVSIINNAAKGVSKPFFLAGDMNCEPDSPPQTAILQTFTVISDVKQNTFPVVNPDQCIDYIYQYRNGQDCAVLKSQTVNEQIASDHLPLYVDVRLSAY
ncbi:MAG: endonuclease/exonuclease/phosphatase family protein [Prevotellaceae bacterium]|jgi:endonuclease/exonuclease/phosphatase family metal-dependent hydrolase|nr:endonuclease/exonuclease/phosphatase family protein [Prevotellaceae bacterium]